METGPLDYFDHGNHQPPIYKHSKLILFFILHTFPSTIPPIPPLLDGGQLTYRLGWEMGGNQRSWGKPTWLEIEYANST